MKTALQIIQAASSEMGLPAPSVVVGSADAEVSQRLALLNAAGLEICSEYIWQALNKEYRFTTSYSSVTATTTIGSLILTGVSSTTGIDATYMVVGVGINTDTYVSTVDSATQITMTQAASASGTVTLSLCKVRYSLPSDFDRIAPRTQWDKTRHWEMMGPDTPQQWQWLKSGYIATGPRVHWRIYGGYFEIWPALSSNEYLGFEYISNGFAVSAAGVHSTSFDADTYTCVFPDRLMICAVKMKYFEAKGFDSSAHTRDYQRQLDLSKSADGASKTLSMAPRLQSILLTQNNIPDSGYGS